MSYRSRIILGVAGLLAAGAALAQPPAPPAGRPLPPPGGVPPAPPGVTVPGPPLTPGGVGTPPGVAPAIPGQLELDFSPATKPEDQTLEQLLDAVEAIQAQKAELEKREQALRKAISLKAEKLLQRIGKLGGEKPPAAAKTEAKTDLLVEPPMDVPAVAVPARPVGPPPLANPPK